MIYKTHLSFYQNNLIMETVTQTKTQEILNHHLSAFMEADVDEVLKDFTEESELLTPDGALKGLNAIRSFLEEVFKMVPKGSTLEPKQMIVRDNLAYITWSGESPFVSIPLGTDSFIIENDKIVYQTLAAHIIPK
jgi:hypothetical protein